MRPARFVHIGITLQQSTPNLGQVIQWTDAVVASESHDWIRYAWNCYLAWSQSDCETIARKILRIPGLDTTSLLVAEISFTGSFGSFPQWVWDWLSRDRGEGPLRFVEKPLPPLLPEP